MEATNNRNLNRAIVEEGLKKRKEDHEEAVRRQEAAHERFERVMIKTVNIHAANARRLRDGKEGSEACEEALRMERIREVRHKIALDDAIRDGNYHMLQIVLSCILFAITVFIGNFFHDVYTHTKVVGIVYRIFLIAWFAYNVYQLYQVSGEIAAITKYGEE